jgi:uridine kinase
VAALDPLSTASRAIASLEDGRRVVAVDGLDGAGKTTFADRLAGVVERPTVRASVDDFHHPRAHRYRRGRDSPDGFYLDSFDYQCLANILLEPFRAGAPFRLRAFDHRSDTPVNAPQEDAVSNAVLILDGLFLHRPELRHWWDTSILLDVPPAVAAARLQRRDGAPPNARYVGAQEMYFQLADPRRHAVLVLPW